MNSIMAGTYCPSATSLPAGNTPSNSRRFRRRNSPIPLHKLVGACRSAPAVFLALLVEAAANGSRVACTSRERLAQLSGVRRLNTISRALTALHQGGWIERVLVPRNIDGQAVTLLRVIVRTDLGHGLLCNGKRRSKRAAKTVAPRGQQKSLHDFLKEGEAHAPPPLRAGGGAPGQGGRSVSPPQTDEPPWKPAELNAQGIPVVIAEAQARLGAPPEITFSRRTP